MIQQRILSISFFLLIHLLTMAQANLFDETYVQYREKALENRRFKHADIKKLIEALPSNLYEVKIAGKSIQGREIYQIKIGTGAIKVLLWSQMHGNEPTATMALFDLFNYLKNDRSSTRNQILESMTLYFIPMLNPDGADAFQRRNALDIDINRDAIRLQSPESKILKEIRDELDPEWGFNLHDQNRYTSAGKTEDMASISFLAPAFNEEKEWNKGRTKAMQLICTMNETLQKYIPGKVGRYSDEFEPRAFGDNIQKWGTNTILIETGSILDDEEKQYLRKLNYISLLTAFKSIHEENYKGYELSDYEKIPFNGGVLHDLLIRNATVHLYDQDILYDIGIRQDEIQDNAAKDFYLRAYVADLGDLHNYFGYEEFDATGYQIRFEKLYDKKFVNLDALKKSDIKGLLSKGYTTFLIQSLPEAEIMARLPFRLIKINSTYKPSSVKIGQNPVLSFWQQNQLKTILVNGYLFEVTDLDKNW
ncbi:MAG: peptidase M14 [Saprospiraceae bacterium]|nr:peptidase M14 [Saprospiraceae bacterium]